MNKTHEEYAEEAGVLANQNGIRRKGNPFELEVFVDAWMKGWLFNQKRRRKATSARYRAKLKLRKEEVSKCSKK